jgi:methylenetetrahydrofolate reductase (NADPH)
MNDSRRLSFEFFPPKTEAGFDKLAATRNELAQLQPAFFSVTYGAGGSTREHTRNAVLATQRAGFSVAPHLSFGDDGEQSVLQLLEEYRAAGIDRIVALRGDLPSGMGITRMVHASELVAFIRRHFGEHFHLEVAAYPEIHPEAKSYDSDIQFLKGKLDAGANTVITQYFYNADAYCWFVDRCRAAGIDAPIYPGIMPITNYQNLARFSAKCGAEIPRWLAQQLDSYGDDQQSVAAFGVEVVSRLCERLLQEGAPGMHFYTMNQAQPTLAICQNVGILSTPHATTAVQ